MNTQAPKEKFTQTDYNTIYTLKSAFPSLHVRAETLCACYNTHDGIQRSYKENVPTAHTKFDLQIPNTLFSILFSESSDKRALFRTGQPNSLA